MWSMASTNHQFMLYMHPHNRQFMWSLASAHHQFMAFRNNPSPLHIDSWGNSWLLQEFGELMHSITCNEGCIPNPSQRLCGNLELIHKIMHNPSRLRIENLSLFKASNTAYQHLSESFVKSSGCCSFNLWRSLWRERWMPPIAAERKNFPFL